MFSGSARNIAMFYGWYDLCGGISSLLWSAHSYLLHVSLAEQRGLSPFEHKHGILGWSFVVSAQRSRSLRRWAWQRGVRIPSLQDNTDLAVQSFFESYSTVVQTGVRVAFDRGACTGAFKGKDDCKKVWDAYGYIVGCNELGKGPYPSCPPHGSDHGEGYCPIAYPGAVWYSLPGPCPDDEFDKCSQRREHESPGGYCTGSPIGSSNCTWTYEEAGEIDIDELVGIKERYGDHNHFCKQGCLEYVKHGWEKDRGRCIDWWDYQHDEARNLQRMQEVDDMFKRKYPHLSSDADLQAPQCDFNRDAFYAGLP